jgi:hypothetical protein
VRNKNDRNDARERFNLVNVPKVFCGVESQRQTSSEFGIEHPRMEKTMTVQELYDLTKKTADPREVEIFLRPHDDEIAEAEFEERDGQVSVYLIEEGAIHL